jgi:RNA polymerase sigma-70 factor (ECF subfamily)
MNANTEDSALMLRYRDGDVAAFETLYLRHKDPLYRYLLRLSLNRDAAEDVFQEVWGKIIKSRRKYRPAARFSTFLYKVAHNCFIDYVRRNKRHSHGISVEPDSQASVDDSPELCAEKAFARKKMYVALALLPEEQRDVFLLYEEAGFSIDIIANITGENRETIKSRLRYAVAKLKTHLGANDAVLESSA